VDAPDTSSKLPPLEEWAQEVPPVLRPLFMRVAGLTDAFCDAHLNEEYKELCRDMAAALCAPESPATKGKPEGWACGVVYSVGWVNFLTDPSQKPHLRSEEIAKGFGVSVATMLAKSKVLREGLGLSPLDPDWCLPSRLGSNPLVWIVQTEEGFVLDVRMASREVQEQAYEMGLIPFIPADHPELVQDIHGELDEAGE
jgi:hypothetical protein